MASRGRSGKPAENQLLRRLPRQDYERLAQKLEPVELTFKQLIVEPDTPIAHVYFPLVGVISWVTKMDEGATVEVATVGNEGFVGLPVFLGAEQAPAKAFVQVPGRGSRMTSRAFREEVARSEPLRAVLNRYTQALFNLIAQSSACNRLHPIEERCARWLLMTHDRMEEDKFPLTQEFLAKMLGVRRATVNLAAGMLQQAGLITYTRGKITVLSRRGLEGAACDCYRIVADEFERLVGVPG